MAERHGGKFCYSSPPSLLHSGHGDQVCKVSGKNGGGGFKICKKQNTLIKCYSTPSDQSSIELLGGSSFEAVGRCDTNDLNERWEKISMRDMIENGFSK